MKKRVGLARAIATEPEIILYDEPTTGLDHMTAQRINDLIIELQRKLGITTIVVTRPALCENRFRPGLPCSTQEDCCSWDMGRTCNLEYPGSTGFLLGENILYNYSATNEHEFTHSCSFVYIRG